MKNRIRRVATSLALLASGLVAGGLTLGMVPGPVVAPAGAATCTAAGGVSVVVDYRELGGTTVTACAADGAGKSAAAIFASVGVAVSYTTRQPGFVCRVNSVPASDPCVNASPSHAYWGLWWADGSTASWTYSSSGVGGLTVPAGGSVGWSWQQDRPSGASVPPGVAPTVGGTPSPTPTASPSASASSTPTSPPSSSTPSNPTSGSGGGRNQGSSGGSGSSTTAEPTPSASPSSSAKPTVAPDPPESSNDTGGSSAPADAPASDGESSRGSTPSPDVDDSTVASDSSADTDAGSAGESGAPSADQPARVPAGITWSIVGLLAIAVAGSGVVARRRRGV